MHISWFEKACFFSSIQSCCIFFLLKQWKCTNRSWLDLFWRKYFFFKLSLMRKDLYIECAIVFHLFHAICSMITQLFFIDVVCWVKTRVFSPFMQCSLFLRNWACIFLCEIFVSFVSELHCWTGSWYDYEWWHWGGQICGFIRWKI